MNNRERKALQSELDSAIDEQDELVAHLEEHRVLMRVMQAEHMDLTALPLDRLTMPLPNLQQLQQAEKEIERRVRDATIKVMGIRRELARVDAQPILQEYDGLATDLYVMMQDMERHILRMNEVTSRVEATYAEAGMTMAEVSQVSYYRLLRLLQHSMATVQIQRGQRYSHDQVAAPLVGKLWVDDAGRSEVVSSTEYQNRLQKKNDKPLFSFKVPTFVRHLQS